MTIPACIIPYISAPKKGTVQYMGTKISGDIRVTLDLGKKFVIPPSLHPSENYVDFEDVNGNDITERSQITHVEEHDNNEEL